MYSPSLDRTEKRVTVIFRGSANLKDFVVDAGIIKHNPVEVVEFSGPKTNLHGGIAGNCSYSIGNTQL